MFEDIAISVKDVSKAYRIWENPSSRLTSPLLAAIGHALGLSILIRRSIRGYRDFWALKPVSFEVRKGEAVAIIGRNGSGKSTLLQIIAGTLQPTEGTVRTSGRVAALLELGSGFNPDFTGRENVFLNGAVLGLSRSEIDSKFDEIAAFAEIDEFIDQPVKTYSSGMVMRLAFAVQTTVEPDVLIVDEALSVGDAPFQAKCFARIRALQARGCSILFVSHDVAAVLALCNHALLLNRGSVLSQGSAKKVGDDYQLLWLHEKGIAGVPKTELGQAGAGLVTRAQMYNAKRSADFERRAREQRSGSGSVRIIDCYLEDQSGNRINLVDFNQEVSVCWLIEAYSNLAATIVLALTAKTVKGQSVLSGTDKQSELLVHLTRGEVVLARMPYRFPLKADHYYFTTSLFGFEPENKFVNGMINFDQATLLDLVEYSCYFEVNWDRRWCHFGPVQQDSTVEITPLSC